MLDHLARLDKEKADEQLKRWCGDKPENIKDRNKRYAGKGTKSSSSRSTTDSSDAETTRGATTPDSTRTSRSSDGRRGGNKETFEARVERKLKAAGYDSEKARKKMTAKLKGMKDDEEREKNLKRWCADSKEGVAARNKSYGTEK